MKLSDVSNWERLDRVRRRMGAPLVRVDWDWDWYGTDRERLLAQLRSEKGVLLDDDLSGLVVNPDLTFSYEGERVLLYIRDQWYGPDREYKYHVAGCRTIDRMFSTGRRNRYVVTNNTTGEFYVVVRQGQTEKFRGTRPMRVCKNCLSALNYEGYAQSPSSKRNRIYAEFELDCFFDQYEEATFPAFPDHDETTAPANVYPPDFSRISMQYRREQNWRCEECGLDLRQHKKWLHTHHINHQRNDNRPSNLSALCLRCHADQPGHERLRHHPEYQAFAQRYPM